MNHNATRSRYTDVCPMLAESGKAMINGFWTEAEFGRRHSRFRMWDGSRMRYEKDGTLQQCAMAQAALYTNLQQSKGGCQVS
jgi:hypothetical protein